MADMRALDVEAGYATVSAFAAGTDTINSIMSTLRAAMDNLASTWHGNSKSQFEGEWSSMVNQTTTVMNRLSEIQNNLNYEVRQVEETFSQ